MKFHAYEESRIGARRLNQDRLGRWNTKEALLMVLADGMGGHPNGEIAAQLAVDCFAAEFARAARPRLANPDQFLSRTLGRAHAAILEHAATKRLADTPRSTVVACVVQDGQAWWSHIGDSRLYFVREGRIVARTRDHTRVQQLLEQGELDEDSAALHPERNRILQCLGSDVPPRPTPNQSLRLRKNDIVLLCSDGFWGPLKQRQLVSALAGGELASGVRELVALAEARAGRGCDNVSVLAIRWNDAGPEPVQEAPTVPRHDLPTDIQDFTATELDFLHMTDADIEREIAEIKAALAKHKPAR